MWADHLLLHSFDTYLQNVTAQKALGQEGVGQRGTWAGVHFARSVCLGFGRGTQGVGTRGEACRVKSHQPAPEIFQPCAKISPELVRGWPASGPGPRSCLPGTAQGHMAGAQPLLAGQ